MSATPRSRRAALVTGAAKRIGREIACALAADGWDLAVHYHASHAQAETLVRELRATGVHAMAVACDLGDAAAVDRLVPECGRTRTSLLSKGTST